LIISQTSLQALRTGFNTQFQSGLATAAPVSDPMVTTLNSSTKVETYGFLGDLPIFRKWLGEKRIRSLAGEPILIETITLPTNRFPDFDHLTIIPNNVYRLYSERWGITIGSAEERLKAIAASARDAARLGCDQGEPLLLISRVARDLENRPVELRWSRCISRDIHYSVNLR